MANMPIFAVGDYSNINRAIDNGSLSYPAFIVTTDEEHYNRLMFLDKDMSLRVIGDGSGGDGVSSYNDLTDVPITNIQGTAVDPITLSELDNGMYSLVGSYQYTDGETIYVTPNETLFVVSTDEYGNKCVAKYGASGAELYYIDGETNTLYTDKFITERTLDTYIRAIDVDTVRKLFE